MANQNDPNADTSSLIEGEDYYVDSSGLFVFTAAYLKKRGFCCESGCRHCPYGYLKKDGIA